MFGEVNYSVVKIDQHGCVFESHATVSPWA